MSAMVAQGLLRRPGRIVIGFVVAAAAAADRFSSMILTMKGVKAFAMSSIDKSQPHHTIEALAGMLRRCHVRTPVAVNLCGWCQGVRFRLG